MDSIVLGDRSCGFEPLPVVEGLAPTSPTFCVRERGKRLCYSFSLVEGKKLHTDGQYGLAESQ